uniref:Achalasia, adrenocortical insufficiency, alacrimia n=1 Tax=Cynoglossus semilaevis TaxID=244447 RepID=A0A3P8X1E6_CYNSE
MWTCERWPCVKGRCHSGCWSPDGSRLLFTVQGISSSTSQGPQAASVVADLSETTFSTPDGDVVVGGEIQSLVWDPRGERLAVLLKGSPSTTRGRHTIRWSLLPVSVGFVQGEPEAEPRLMQFHPNFQHGALLTVCWSTGRITHVPFYFLSAGAPLCGLSGSPLLPLSQDRPSDLVNKSLFTEMISSWAPWRCSGGHKSLLSPCRRKPSWRQRWSPGWGRPSRSLQSRE